MMHIDNPVQATAASTTMPTSPSTPVLQDITNSNCPNISAQSNTPIIRVPSRKSPPTCTITLANASTLHNNSDLTMEMSIVPFPQESSPASCVHTGKSENQNDDSVSIASPATKFSKSDSPHALFKPSSAMLYSQALSSSGGPRSQPSGPRRRATSIQPPRNRTSSIIKCASGPRPLQLASSATVLCSGSTSTHSSPSSSSSSPSPSGTPPTSKSTKPLITVAPRPSKPKRPSSDLRFQALVQRSITRGLKSCTCHWEALAASSASSLYASSQPTSQLNDEKPLIDASRLSDSDRDSWSLSVVLKTSNTPPPAPRRCVATFDSFNSQTFRLAQKLHTRLLSKGLEPSELILPPPVHKSISLPPSGDKKTRARSGVGIEIVALEDRCDDNAVGGATDNESPFPSVLFSPTSPSPPAPMTSELPRSSASSPSTSGSPPFSPTLPPSRYHHLVLDHPSLIANMFLRHYNKDRYRSRGPLKHVDPTRLGTTVPRTPSPLKVEKGLTLGAAYVNRVEKVQKPELGPSVPQMMMRSIQSPMTAIHAIPIPAAMPRMVSVGAC